MRNNYLCAVRRKEKILRSVEVSDYAAEGRSLARVDGKVIFIEGAVPGDKVDVLLSKSKKDWAEGKAIHIHTYSDKRVDAFCDHFGLCGGCKWQMLPYEQQLQYKQQETEAHLRRIGKIELPPIRTIAGAAETRGYRNKLEFTFSSRRYLTREEMQTLPMGADVGGAVGFHVPRIFDKVIDIHHCHFMEEPQNGIRNFIREMAVQQGYSLYDIRAHEGWLRTMIIRTASNGEVMVNITLGHDHPQWRKELFDALLKAFPSITTLLYTINTKWNDSIFDLQPIVYFGPGYIFEQLEGYRFKIGPKSFFQTNTRQAEQLYRITRDMAQLTGKEVLYDLYCGTGGIGIFCSANAAKVVGVETIAEAVEDAKENSLLNKVQHASFFAGDVIDVCTTDFFNVHGRPDVIITDPPRAGMHEKLVKKLLEIHAPRIVYVSCNPATQARDLQLLDEKYSVTDVQPVDMFDHTHHIESVVALTAR